MSGRTSPPPSGARPPGRRWYIVARASIPPGRHAARDGAGPPNYKEGSALTPRNRGLRCRQRPRLRAVPPGAGGRRCRWSSAPRKGGTRTGGCGRGRTRPCAAVGPSRRSRLRPPVRDGRALFEGPYHTSGALTSSPYHTTCQSLPKEGRRRGPSRPPAQRSKSGRRRERQGGACGKPGGFPQGGP